VDVIATHFQRRLVSNCLSSSLLKKIKENVNSNSDLCYFFKEDLGEERGSITSMQGLAETVFKNMVLAGYKVSYGLYDDESANKFKEYLDDKDALKELIEFNNKPKFTFDNIEEFKDNLASPFSNFYPAKFEYNEYIFISNEQFIAFSKAKTFGDEVTANRIINIYNEFQKEPSIFKSIQDKLCFQLASEFKNGNIIAKQILLDKEGSETWNFIHKKIKTLSKDVKNYDDKSWKNKKNKVIFFGAKLKFTQNLDLKQIILNIDNCTTQEEKYNNLPTMTNILQKLKVKFSTELRKKIKP
jgi:predicted NAD-dependent protein-ADP-ribosyltransferase YbiA (DUF1768 family)